MTKTKNQTERVMEMRAEIVAKGGAITTFEDLPLDIEEQLLRRSLERPEYIEIERESRPEGM